MYGTFSCIGNYYNTKEKGITSLLTFVYIYIYIYIYICIYTHTHTNIVQKVLSLTQILNLLHISHLWMGLTCIKIKTDIWISFSSFISVSVLSQQNFQVWFFFLGEAQNFWNDPHLCLYIYITALLLFKKIFFEEVSLFNGISTFVGTLMPKPFS